MLRTRVIAVFLAGVFTSACPKPKPPPPPPAGVCAPLKAPENPATFVQLIEFTGSAAQPCVPSDFTFDLPGPGGAIQTFQLRRDFLMADEGRLRAFCKWTLINQPTASFTLKSGTSPLQLGTSPVVGPGTSPVVEPGTSPVVGPGQGPIVGPGQRPGKGPTISRPGVWPKLADLRIALRQRKLLVNERASIKPDYLGMARVSAEAGGLGQAHWRFHRHRFLTAVGAFELSKAFPSAFAAAEQGKNRSPRPRLAIIDSAPSSKTPGWTDGLPADAYLDHGVALARVAEDLLCHEGNSNGPCLADVVSVQALDPDSKGSFRGSLGALAAAIYRAVDEAPAPDRLTINLSLGWINFPALGGEFGDIYANPSETPAAGAVHEAIQYARCHGASVVAAAGNRVGAYDSCLEENPIFPARWVHHGVNARLCRTEFQKNLRIKRDLPLLISAGAVADYGQALSLHRKNSAPLVRANGMAAIAPQRGLKSEKVSGPTALMSGTSVSTLVTSAAVALMQNSGVPALASEQMVLTTPMPLKLSKLAADNLPSVAPPSGWSSPQPWVSPGSLVIVPDDVLSIDSSVAVCSFNGKTVKVMGLGMSACSILQRPSADQSPFLHEQPNPSGGDDCPGCTMINEFSTLAMRAGFNSLVSATGGPSLFVQKTKKIGFERAFLEIITPTFNRFYALPQPPEPKKTYQIPLPGLSDIDPETDRARIVFFNAADQVVFASEVFVTNKAMTKLADLSAVSQ
ncbi:MAG: S8/S53 family peptidase [Myxococcota bacterium]